MIECSRAKYNQVEPWWSVVESSRVKKSNGGMKRSDVESSRALVECSRAMEECSGAT